MRVAGTGSRLLWWPSWTAMTRLMPTEAERATAQEGTVRRGGGSDRVPPTVAAPGHLRMCFLIPASPWGLPTLNMEPQVPCPPRHTHAHAHAHSHGRARGVTQARRHTRRCP